MEIAILTFNAFEENTYILYDDTQSCVIIDPGCYGSSENQRLFDYITSAKLIPRQLLLTHAHLDHVFGCQAVFDKYGLAPFLHTEELVVYNSATVVGQQYGFEINALPSLGGYIAEGESISFGETTLSVLFTPGHSPGGICFVHEETKTIISGDVLFQQSIGRTDLPGGDYDTLIGNIKDKIMTYSDDWKVYPGHGPSTTIGYERQYNSFLQ